MKLFFITLCLRSKLSCQNPPTDPYCTFVLYFVSLWNTWKNFLVTNGNLSDKKTSVFQLVVHLNFKYIYFDVIQFYFFVANKKIKFDSKDITNIHRAFFYCLLLRLQSSICLLGITFTWSLVWMNLRQKSKAKRKKENAFVLTNLFTFRFHSKHIS